MVAIKNLFFLATTASALVLPRADYTTVVNDLKQADTDTNTLTSQINAYTGSGSQTLQIRSSINKLKTDLNTASSDTDASSSPTAAQGQSVLDYINSPLFGDVQSSLTATKNKKSTFTTAGLKGEVLQDLKDLKTATDNLATKLINKAPTSQLATDGTTTKNKFDAAFDDAISFYS